MNEPDPTAPKVNLHDSLNHGEKQERYDKGIKEPKKQTPVKKEEEDDNLYDFMVKNKLFKKPQAFVGQALSAFREQIRDGRNA
jgi:hypothetical protein